MAYIDNTAFEIKVSNHEFDATANITGLYNNASDQAEACSAGFLCVRSQRLNNEGYVGLGPSGATVTLKNMNSWIMKAAPAATLAQEGIYACNTFDVNEIADPVTGAVYKVGSNTLGMPIPAGKRGTFTKIHFDNDHVYRFGAGNINGTVGSNKYFTVAAGLLVPAAAAPTGNGAPYFELVDSGNFTQGAYNGFGYYDLRACMAVGSTTAGS